MIRVGSRWLPVAVPGLAQAREGPLALARQQARERRQRAGQAAGDAVSAPMQGTVVRVTVTEGEQVDAGQVLAIVEAMKMENPLRAPHAGQVAGLRVSAGDTVAQGTVLCRVVPDVPCGPGRRSARAVTSLFAEPSGPLVPHRADGDPGRERCG